MDIEAAIAIVTYNGERWIGDCVESLYRQNWLAWDLFIYDNDSTDNTRHILERIAKAHKNVTVIFANENLGFTGGYNRLLKIIDDAKKYKYAILLNQDTVVHPDWAKELVRIAKQKDVALVGSNVKDLTEYPRYSKFGRPLWFLPTLGAIVYGDYTRKPKNCNFVAGTACCLKMESIQGLGGNIFDEKMFMYHEDIDLSIRLVSNGYKLMFAPSAIVWHNNAVSDWVAYYVVRNLFYLIFKNFGFLFFIRFINKLIAWSVLSSKQITNGSMNSRERTKAFIDALKMMFTLPIHRPLYLQYLSSVPSDLLEAATEELKENNFSDFIFHA